MSEEGGAGGRTIDRRSFMRRLAAAMGGGGLAAMAPLPWVGGRADTRATPLVEDRAGIAAPGRAGLDASDRSGIDAPARTGWGVQLYTLREVVPSNVETTLQVIAGFGYESVELAGLYGRAPFDMRQILDDVGLRAASSHHSIGEVRGDWARTLAGAATLGQDLIVVPSLPSDERDRPSLLRIAEEFNRAGEAAKELGIRFGYHNHDWELRPWDDGTRPMDLLLENTDPDLVDWQMDIFWTVHGGADPLECLASAGARVTSVHVKDRSEDGRMVDVGDGVIDFARILRAADRQALMHAFVEHDNPDNPIESVRKAIASLAG